MSQQLQNQDSVFHQQFSRLTPQIKIYNRNFHLRRVKHEQLVQEKQRQIYQLASKPKLSSQSYQILIQKMQKQLRRLIQRYAEDGQIIDYEAFQNIVIDLGEFIIDKEQTKRSLEEIITQLWLLLIQYDLNKESVEEESVQGLLTILFCPHSLRLSEMVELLSSAFPDLEENRRKYVQQYPQAKEQLRSLQQIVEFWIKLKYAQFSLNKKKKTKPQTFNTFQPTINEKSKLMAEKSLKKYLSSNRFDNINESKLNQLSGYISSGRELSYHQILYKRGLQKEQLLKTNREQENYPIERDQRTLTTSQVKNLVSNLHINKERKQDVDYEKRKEEQNLKFCTFKPQINKEYSTRSTTPDVRNYNKEIERLQKGRRQKQKQKEAIENLGRVKKKNFAPPSFIQRDKPKLILEIKVGDKIEELKLKGDQDPLLVAKKFIKKHGLQDQMMAVLRQVIEQQLTAL